MSGQDKNSQPLDDQSERGQVNRSAAQVYEEFFLPALFQEWPERVTEAAKIVSGQRVLDVACGTGVLARHAAGLVGPTGSVVGLDINEGMLEVARRKAPQVEWRHGQAEALPFGDDSFDAVVSQFGLMFFVDQARGLQEMRRVLRPGGYLAVAVWDRLENTPGYATMVDILLRLFGEGAAGALRSPYNLGERERLKALFSKAGMPDAQISTLPGMAHFPSIDSWVFTDVKGWTLADMIDEAQFSLLLDEAHRALKPFVRADGSVAFDSPAHIVTVRKEVVM